MDGNWFGGRGGGVEGRDDHDPASWVSPQRSLVTADGQGPWWNSEGGLLHRGAEIGREGWRKTEREKERDRDKALVSLWCYSAERGYVEINACPSEMNLADQNAGLTIPVDTQR